MVVKHFPPFSLPLFSVDVAVLAWMTALLTVLVFLPPFPFPSPLAAEPFVLWPGAV